MECPECEMTMEILNELSRGMGNQSFAKCPFCGTVVLCSGEIITQVWTGNVQEGGKKCRHSAHTEALKIA